jgi:ethanolamine ammonia-lyase large subunit
MDFEPRQGSALSAGDRHGVNQQTCEARACAVARKFEPMRVNTLVGSSGALADHFCGKVLGLPIERDVCYTNHANYQRTSFHGALYLQALLGLRPAPEFQNR